MSKPLRVLIIEDSEDDALLLLRGLSRAGFEPDSERVETPDAMAAALSGRSWDIILSDYSMPHFSGLEALSLLQRSGQDIPFILVSGTIGENLAVDAVKAGAHDYVMKGNLQRLNTSIERELRDVEGRRARKQEQEWVKYLAQYDPLTDLPNRNLLYERIEQTLVSARSENMPFALMFMDLDRFKEVNDSIGHQAGDSLLQQVGIRLQGVARKADTVARLGGDEFGVLLPEMDAQGAALAANKFLKAFERPFLLGEISLTIQPSIGIALFPQHGDKCHTLMRCADIAMYLAKESSSGYAVYSVERDSHTPERLAVITELHHAIDNNQLFLAYQPKINLKTGAVTGLEALARWQHPKLGFIPPDQFIPMAERTGLIKSLTVWALNAALSQSRAWRAQGLEIPVSVNLSARSLHDVNLPDQLTDVLRTHDARPEHLEIEITESVIMTDMVRALDILKRINSMGISLYIDDFGTGYSSLGYLKKLPANAIKIDKSFVMNMTADENDAMIVRSTIDLAHNLGLKVIAEGVENREVWDRLLALGCDEAQGYYMSRPLPAPEITKWLYDSPWGLTKTTRLTHSNKELEL
jgi:diguanylate cyclase (GGDEF)-like protein